MLLRSSNVLAWHPANRQPPLSILSRNSASPRARLMRILPYIEVLQGLYSTSRSLDQIYHMRFSKSVFTCMHLAQNTCLLSNAFYVMFRGPYILHYTYRHPPLQSLSPTPTLIGEDVLTPDAPHPGTAFISETTLS